MHANGLGRYSRPRTCKNQIWGIENMQHLNYCRQAMTACMSKSISFNKDFDDIIIGEGRDGKRIWEKTIDSFPSMLGSAAKFILPENGVTIEDPEFRGIDEKEKLRLPIDTVALEYYDSADCTKNIIIAQERTFSAARLDVFYEYVLVTVSYQRKNEQWKILPDLLIVDGGKGQLGVAVKVLEELGLEEEIPVASLAKRFEEVYLPHRSGPVEVPRGSDALYLLQRIRDEAHRFAVSFHRELRGKRMTKSVLDDIPGLGEARRARLIKELGGVTAVKRATEEELKALAWLPDSVGQAVWDKIHVPSRRDPR
jgi:hypothetical protein